METFERPVAMQVMLIAAIVFCITLLGCGGEWVSATVGKTSCSFGTFDEFLPALRTPIKMAAGNNGNNLYILDNSSYVHSYKRDNLYECAFTLENSYYFNGFPNDVFFANNSFYVQDGATLKSQSEEECYAKNGVFAIYGNELAVGDNMGIKTWNIKPCAPNVPNVPNVSSQRILALAATSNEYFAVEGITSEPRNLTRYSKTSGFVYSDPMSSIPGDEKNFCAADRIIADNYGVYLLDKKCKKIGIFDNQGIWRKSIKLDSLRIRGTLDIAPGEYSYIFILHDRGVDKVNVF